MRLMQAMVAIRSSDVRSRASFRPTSENANNISPPVRGEKRRRDPSVFRPESTAAAGTQ